MKKKKLIWKFNYRQIVMCIFSVILPIDLAVVAEPLQHSATETVYCAQVEHSTVFQCHYLTL